MRSRTEEAFAKINLFLDVTGIRDDGYHTIDGVMQSVSLSDRLTVGWEPCKATEISIVVEGNPDLTTGEDNLACRAARKYLEASGKTGIVKIRLEKRIPVAAGLAGGSTDAAAVLRALNRMMERPLERAELQRIAVSLGADVPFCLWGGTMRTRGIGDQLTPCEAFSGVYFVICCAGEGVSTPWAYREFDRVTGGIYDPDFCRENVQKLIDALQKKDKKQICEKLYNAFERVIFPYNPKIGELNDLLLSFGAVCAQMSGSGPSVFGVFQDRSVAVSAVARLREEGYRGYLCVAASIS